MLVRMNWRMRVESRRGVMAGGGLLVEGLLAALFFDLFTVEEDGGSGLR